MNILVTGCNGQLGTYLRLLSDGAKHNYIFTDINELDITSEAAVNAFIRHNDIDVIINCAAYTNVDRAEEDEEVADRVNHIAPRILAEAAFANDALLIHISTDYVFGGTLYNTPIVEQCPANPTGVYGRTKLLGEQAVQQSGCKYTIIRTAWLYSEYGKNFLKTMLSLTATRPEVRVVFDQVGSPTYAADLAGAIIRIIDADLSLSRCKIFNYTNEGVCSWFDFAHAIAEIAGNASCRIVPCRSAEYPSRVVRPPYAVLDKNLIKQTFGIEIPYWTDSLRKCLYGLGVVTH